MTCGNQAPDDLLHAYTIHMYQFNKIAHITHSVESNVVANAIFIGRRDTADGKGHTSSCRICLRRSTSPVMLGRRPCDTVAGIALTDSAGWAATAPARQAARRHSTARCSCVVGAGSSISNAARNSVLVASRRCMAGFQNSQRRVMLFWEMRTALFRE